MAPLSEHQKTPESAGGVLYVVNCAHRAGRRLLSRKTLQNPGFQGFKMDSQGRKVIVCDNGTGVSPNFDLKEENFKFSVHLFVFVYQAA